MYKLGWKEQLFKASDVLMLGRGCGVSKYPQFYDRIKKICKMLPRPYKERYPGDKGHQCFKNHGFFHYTNQLKHFLWLQ